MKCKHIRPRDRSRLIEERKKGEGVMMARGDRLTTCARTNKSTTRVLLSHSFFDSARTRVDEPQTDRRNDLTDI